jgi:hypothetical protein
VFLRAILAGAQAGIPEQARAAPGGECAAMWMPSGSADVGKTRQKTTDRQPEYEALMRFFACC